MLDNTRDGSDDEDDVSNESDNDGYANGIEAAEVGVGDVRPE